MIAHWIQHMVFEINDASKACHLPAGDRWRMQAMAAVALKTQICGSIPYAIRGEVVNKFILAKASNRACLNLSLSNPRNRLAEAQTEVLGC